jgi:hypothetical protein
LEEEELRVEEEEEKLLQDRVQCVCVGHADMCFMDSGYLHQSQGPSSAHPPGTALSSPSLVLTSAFFTAQTYNIDVVAVVNDTVGTMMGCEPGVGPCEVALIVGEPCLFELRGGGVTAWWASPDGVIPPRHRHQRMLHGGSTACGRPG